MIDDLLVMALLAFVALSCAAGAVSPCYAGTLLQKVGLAGVSLWATWEAFLIHDYGYVSPEIVFGAIGMSIFSAGTIIKTWRWHRYESRMDKRSSDAPSPAKRPGWPR